MKKILTIFAVGATLLAVSCTKESNAPEAQEGRTIQLTLDATRGDADTKTAITGNDTYHSLESKWSSGDVIYVYSIKSGAELGTLTQTDDITNQKTSETAQYETSYAQFQGSITLGDDDVFTDKFAFVYQGSGNSKSVDADALLTFDMGYSTTVDGLNAWDIAYATGKIIDSSYESGKTVSSASAAVSFSNRLAFGYFSTEGVGTGNIDMNYYSSFTLNVKTGTVIGLSGQVTVPANTAKIYMPLVPGTVNMTSDKVWDTDGDIWTYTSIHQATSFTASAGNYYRLGKSSGYGPVMFENDAAGIKYNTMRNRTFKVGESESVHFTEGNLQWISLDANDADDGYWQIAPTQYSYLGLGNAKGDSNESSSKLAAGNVDLFGWGEVTAPFLCSTVNSDYQLGITSANVNLTTDWATKFNGDTPLYADYNNTKEYPLVDGEEYCVLTKDQWVYLFQNQYWGFATVTLSGGNTVCGIVVCPSDVDEATATTYLNGTVRKLNNSTSVTGLSSAYDENAIAQSVIDDNGLLFLPAAGYRAGYGAPSFVGSNGGYWYTTASAADKAYRVSFNAASLYSANGGNRYDGFSVRLASLAK